MAHHQTETSPIEVQEHLKGANYPASKEDLVAAARANKAPEHVIQTLEKLPAKRYEGPPGVMKAYAEVK